MIVDEVGAGRKLTYRFVLPDGKVSDKFVMTVLTELDGKDVPVMVNGAPTGETMGIRRIDSNHTFTVLKFQGKEIGTSKLELSPDGKVLKIENDIATARGIQEAGKHIEYWDKK